MVVGNDSRTSSLLLLPAVSKSTTSNASAATTSILAIRSGIYELGRMFSLFPLSTAMVYVVVAVASGSSIPIVGELEGCSDTLGAGLVVGLKEGSAESVGDRDGVDVGNSEGRNDGCDDGSAEGISVGELLGCEDTVGLLVPAAVGNSDGDPLGAGVGLLVGIKLGNTEGWTLVGF